MRISCADCRHFNHEAEELEACFPGLASLSSAYASVRCEDGICEQHDRYVAAASFCAQHQARQEPTPRAPETRSN